VLFRNYTVRVERVAIWSVSLEQRRAKLGFTIHLSMRHASAKNMPGIFVVLSLINIKALRAATCSDHLSHARTKRFMLGLANCRGAFFPPNLKSLEGRHHTKFSRHTVENAVFVAFFTLFRRFLGLFTALPALSGLG